MVVTRHGPDAQKAPPPEVSLQPDLSPFAIQTNFPIPSRELILTPSILGLRILTLPPLDRLDEHDDDLLMDCPFSFFNLMI